MARTLAAVMVLLVVFAAGVATGRALLAPQSEATSSEAPTPPLRGSEAQPVAMGEEAEVGPWLLRVEHAALDGARRILEANQFNTAPPEGTAFVLVDVAVRRREVGPGVLRGSVVPALTTPTGRRYALGTDCGVLPAALDPQQPIGPGQELQGQWCWAVADHDLPKISLRVGTATGDAMWFALR